MALSLSLEEKKSYGYLSARTNLVKGDSLPSHFAEQQKMECEVRRRLLLIASFGCDGLFDIEQESLA